MDFLIGSIVKIYDNIGYIISNNPYQIQLKDKVLITEDRSCIEEGQLYDLDEEQRKERVEYIKSLENK